MARLMEFDRCPQTDTSRKVLRRQSEAGQIVFEYVLLLAIAISVALLLTRTLVSRTPGNEGMIIRAWQTLSTQIGADFADDVDPTAAAGAGNTNGGP